MAKYSQLVKKIIDIGTCNEHRAGWWVSSDNLTPRLASQDEAEGQGWVSVEALIERFIDESYSFDDVQGLEEVLTSWLKYRFNDMGGEQEQPAKVNFFYEQKVYLVHFSTGDKTHPVAFFSKKEAEAAAANATARGPYFSRPRVEEVPLEEPKVKVVFEEVEYDAPAFMGVFSDDENLPAIVSYLDAVTGSDLVMLNATLGSRRFLPVPFKRGQREQ